MVFVLSTKWELSDTWLGGTASRCLWLSAQMAFIRLHVPPNYCFIHSVDLVSFKFNTKYRQKKKSYTISSFGFLQYGYYDAQFAGLSPPRQKWNAYAKRCLYA